MSPQKGRGLSVRHEIIILSLPSHTLFAKSPLHTVHMPYILLTDNTKGLSFNQQNGALLMLLHVLCIRSILALTLAYRDTAKPQL